jgi:hypothetical protein
VSKEIDQSQLLELIEPIVNEAVPGVHGTIYIVRGLGYLAALGVGTRVILPGEAEDAWRAVGRVGGEVILGTAASVAETLGYPGWWLGLKAAECLIGVTQSGQSPYALDERIAEAGATSLWSPSAGPAESAVDADRRNRRTT